MVRSVIKTVGGKFFLKDTILRCIPPHKCWVEVFCGAAHVTLAKEPSEVEVINDIDDEIYAFFRVLRDNPDELVYKILLTPYSRKQFNVLKAMKPENDLEKAWRFFCINWMTFGGKRTSQATFGYSIERRPVSISIEKFTPLIDRLKNIIIENLDFREIIKRYDGENVVMYADPPYVGAEDYYDTYRFTEQDHIDLADILKSTKAKWILSYGDHPLVRELYKSFYITEEKRYNNVKRSLAVMGESRSTDTELIITNFSIDNLQYPLFTPA